MNPLLGVGLVVVVLGVFMDAVLPDDNKKTVVVHKKAPKEPVVEKKAEEPVVAD